MALDPCRPQEHGVALLACRRSGCAGLGTGALDLVPEPLEIASQSLAAILATWLGLTVVSRAPSQRGPRVFAWVTLLLLAWSVSILIERTSSDASVRALFNDLEDVSAFLLPPAALHIVLAFTIEGRYARWQTIVLTTGYVVAVVMGLHKIADPGHPVQLSLPRFEPPFASGEMLAWAWIGFRIAFFLIAIGLAAAAYMHAGSDRLRRRQTLAALWTVALASLGGTLRFLPREVGGPNSGHEPLRKPGRQGRR
jgi:hypothetical protein